MPLFLADQSHEAVALSGGGSGGRPIFELLHIEVFLLLPDLVFLRQQGADQAECRSVVGKDADHPFAPSESPRSTAPAYSWCAIACGISTDIRNRSEPAPFVSTTVLRLARQGIAFIPSHKAKRPARTLVTAFATATSGALRWKSDTVSRLNAEKVVKPPSSPVKRKRRRSGPITE